ncbi:hypothetical protein SLEP1_g20100 [Rubroshorea leprosula]|uniref:Uncharacterized protein n=1 Tax=Rubroshorea leprosula TaxID=152421 RepID=A0AAV5J953_9ROSI|nr:hypothetical protein SLEP1_g20100 [Rubroshorea leprosula]
MRDSTTVAQIVEIVKMLVEFHPLLTVTGVICRVILLQDWIEEEVNIQWKALKMYCQSTMRALLYLITEKMENLSKALQMHLNNEAVKGQPKAKLIDLGLFSFIIGVIGSITYNCFKFTSPTWIVAFICFVLFSFKSWLDKYWLELEQHQSLTSENTQARSTSVILSAGVRLAKLSFVASVVKTPLSNYKLWLARSIGSVACSLRIHQIYPKDTPLPSENTKGVSSSILTIVNVAQGMFCFFPKDLLPPSTNTKGITGMILSFQSVVTYGIMVLVGLEPRLYCKDWLATIIRYILWWVQLGGSIPKDLVMSTIEFNALQWWIALLCITISDIIFWIHQSTTSH